MSDILSMLKQLSFLKWAKLLGNIYFLLMLIGVFYFFRERIYIDPATQIFDMINGESIEVYVGRYSMILSQLLPVLAIKLGASVKVIVALYFISFVLIYYSCFYLCVYKLKNISAGLVICLAALSISHTFFHAISETMQLFGFAALWYAWIKFLYEKGLKSCKWSDLVLTIVILALNFFIHPVSLFFVVFGLGLLLVEKQEWKNKWFWGVLIIWGMFFAFKMLLSRDEGSHETGFFSELFKIPELLPRFTELYPMHFIGSRFSKLYLFPVLLLAITQVLYVKRKKYWLMAYTLVFNAAFLFISIVVYNQGDSDHGMERSFLPLAFFIGLPFLKEVFENNLKSSLKLGVALLAIIGVLNGVQNVVKDGKIFQKRENVLSDLIEKAKQYNGSKFYVDKSVLSGNDMLVSYNLAVETLLLSLLDNEAPKTIFLDKRNIVTAEDLQNPDLFLFADYYARRNQSELNTDFFPINGFYTELNFDFNPETALLCGAEEVDENAFFISSGEKFSGGSYQSSEAKYKGEFSVALNVKQPFGFTYNFTQAKEGQKIRVSVYRKGVTEASLVVANDNGLYLRQTESSSTDSLGWGKLELVFEIMDKEDLVGLKTYVWNPNDTLSYFDNLLIETTTK